MSAARHRRDAAGRRAGRGLLGHGARDPVRAQRPARSRLWGRDARAAGAAWRAERCNERYLPTRDASPTRCRLEPDLPHALGGARDVLIVVPSHAFRALLDAARAAPRRRRCSVAWATKGFEQGSRHAAAPGGARGAGPERRVAVLSGPTFAREVGAGLPTAMTIASPDAAFASALAQELSSANFRAYTSTDIMGVEIGGAVKNVLAVGAGLSRWPGLRRQHARRAHHARPGGDDAPGRRARGAAGHLHGARRASATWCSPAPTTSRATAASGCCWPPAPAPAQALAEIGQVGRGLPGRGRHPRGRRPRRRRHAAVRGGLPRAVRGPAGRGRRCASS